MKPGPFIPWVGGKRQLLPELTARLPLSIQDYHEPFIGAGALFFELKSLKRVQGRSFISDINPDLVLCYKTIKENPKELLGHLAYHKERRNREYFYLIRDQNFLKEDIARAARFIFLQKTCFSALLKYNKKGHKSMFFVGI